jgi:serine/threonine-protein kinase RsbW
MGVAGSNRHGDANPPRRLVFNIPSDLGAGRAVQKQILDDVRRHGVGGNTFFAINLALEEALTNAIRHGNRLDPKKNVHVEAEVTPNRVEILIEDDGPGFDRNAIPDPTAEENLEKCSGRGILLIEAYMSNVFWERGGRRLRMIKEIEPQPAPKT